MKTIDLNCDVGEGINNEELLMPFLSSCNIACGMHAGDESTMRRVVDLAASHEVAVGAHPSFKDRENFGRKEMDLELEEITNLVKIQILKLKEICEEKGTSLHHVKPHGALYNQAAKSSEISEAIVRAVEEVDPSLQLYGLADSEMQSACSGRIPFIAEG
ncbi:MAG: LamB/YcsF family protein, partial [Cyclobacteriaceae bacterium]